MDVYISVDMEGMAGVATFEQIRPGERGYERARRLMTGEANAAILGAFDGGASAVWVNDSHGPMDNLLVEDLDPRARVIVGRPKPDSMMAGLASSMGVALLVGYHAAAGQQGVLAHTITGPFAEVRVNGALCSEAYANALLAASRGVPVGLLTGDEAICSAFSVEAPGVRTVAVKRHLGMLAADSLHPEVACERIRGGAEEAVRGAGDLSVLEVPDALRVRVRLASSTQAERVALVPQTIRVDAHTVEQESSNPSEMLRLLAAWALLARAGA